VGAAHLRSEYIIGIFWNAGILLPKSGMVTRCVFCAGNWQEIPNHGHCNKCDLPYGISYAGRGILNKLFAISDKQTEIKICR